jgi:arylsulfatase A-like enzyme
MTNQKQILFSLMIFFLTGSISSKIFAQSDQQQPNIVLILADDLALMDLGIYGGEAATPNINMLANKGTIFTNYHTSPSCAPSRAMLLTGYDSHLTGVPNLPLFLPPEQASEPGYEGILNSKVKTIATHLKQNGYKTFVTGKWHLGHTEKTLPSKRGFDRTFILDASGADNFEHKAYLPSQSKPKWFEDGKEIDLPEDFYSSRSLVDKMIQFMDEEQVDTQPFFSFLSFQAVHIPVQAPKEFTEKYERLYDKGWDDLRLSRFDKAKQLGLIPPNTQLNDMLPVMQNWENQSEEDKKRKSKAMAVYAAMIEAMDFHIGRYVQYLEEKDLMDNTIFVITSDNGAEASDPSLVNGMGLWLKYAGYDTGIENLGEKGSWNFIGPEFASAVSSPSSFFKFHAGEGGLRVPLIISGGNLPKEQKKNAMAFVFDITPTILNIAGINPSENITKPFTGHSLFPLINNETERIYKEDEPIGIEAAGHAALFRGDMKIVRNGKPYGDFIWRMYDIKKDPGEVQNLATIKPELFESMLNDYKNYSKEVNVLEMAEDYDMFEEIKRKSINKIIHKSKPWVVGILVIFCFLFIRKYRGRNQIQNS